jgi:hypothetical protein
MDLQSNPDIFRVHMSFPFQQTSNPNESEWYGLVQLTTVVKVRCVIMSEYVIIKKVI